MKLQVVKFFVWSFFFFKKMQVVVSYKTYEGTELIQFGISAVEQAHRALTWSGEGCPCLLQGAETR